MVAFMIKDNDVLAMHNDIWDEIREMINTEFDCKPIYDDNYIKKYGKIIW